MPNIWRYQYLEDEKLHYITECHPEDGILGEHFFENHEYGDMIKFCLDNNLSFEMIQLPIFEKADNGEYFMGNHKLADIDYSCRIKLYDEDREGTLFKSKYKLTLEMIEELPAETLGKLLKELHRGLKDYIHKQTK